MIGLNEGCCSAASPCEFQKRNPGAICGVCAGSAGKITAWVDGNNRLHYADGDALAERAPTEHWEWSEYYYRRARDGMMEYLRDNRAWSISKDQGAREFDEAFRHAVDILALSVRRQSPAVTESCTLCADDDSPGFYKGCMVRDKYGDAHLDWNCDGKGNLTRRSQPETSNEIKLAQAMIDYLQKKVESNVQVLKKIEYASRKDSLTDQERLQSVRSTVCSALSSEEPRG